MISADSFDGFTNVHEVTGAQCQRTYEAVCNCDAPNCRATFYTGPGFTGSVAGSLTVQSPSTVKVECPSGSSGLWATVTMQDRPFENVMSMTCKKP
ncbi:unnamed protein product [Enterobius vermicularis]|uniref:C6 domain-containing protein n=1 Tax=Enterobius vermicularis TaxID=51028 RepID=A0A0N4VFC5_ENTVE|nr:unnamed protein product [Enterobius vermicularis]